MSLVRLCCENVYALSDEDRVRCGEIWPELKTNPEKWITLKDKLVELEEIPDWVADVAQLHVKPLKRVRFVQPDAPDLKNFQNAEVREFVKNVSQIVMPGFELLRYGHIQVIEDACSNDIQFELDKGWRIIAVCPQPSQRRPDYVMVKKEELDG